MNKTKVLLLALFCGVLAVTAFSQPGSPLKRTTTKTDKFDFGAGGTVSIAGAPNGSIHVVGGNRNEIEITAEVELQASTEADLAKLSEVTGFITNESTGKTSIIIFYEF